MIQKKQQITKTLHIRPNGRSADFITPNFVYGCAGGCRNSYCYVMRFNYDSIYTNTNVEQILDKIDQHIGSLPPKLANQTDPKYWTYDIGCSTDVCLHWKNTDWLIIFEFFKNHPKAKATFATKYVNKQLLNFAPEGKVRIRFSLMPTEISKILEPNTSSINDRILAINEFLEVGYDVHLNFSPIVAYESWLIDYENLFKQIEQNIDKQYKPLVKAECIFLTHNESQHLRNMSAGKTESEKLIWMPNIQEQKTSEYGGKAVRYKQGIKSDFIKRWQALHNHMLPWNTIRYIF